MSLRIFRKIFCSNRFISQRSVTTSAKYSAKKPCEDPCDDRWSKFFKVKPEADVFHEHAGNSHMTAKVLSLMVGIPVVLFYSFYLYYTHEHPKRPPFVPYTYLNIRNKPFPWGDGQHSFFHNPRVNAMKDGYETEEDEDH